MTAQPAYSLYTIPAAYAFADCLARGLVERYAAQDDPLALASHLILVPNRRAVRVVREAFLRIGDGTPMLLPAIRPLGDVAEDDVLFAEESAAGEDASASLFSAEEALDIPSAFGGLERDLALARLVHPLLSGEDQTVSPAMAAALGRSLGRFLDSAVSERADLTQLESLAPEEFAHHWQKVLTFLQVLSEAWPGYCKAAGRVDAADRRTQLIETLMKRWQSAPPRHGITIAGSTGSLPAVAELMVVIAALPEGEVVLPGLDRALDDESYKDLPPGHPQAGLKRLLEVFQVGRNVVQDWPGLPDADTPLTARTDLLAEVMRPAETTDLWRAHKTDWPDARLSAALEGVATITAPAEREEAEAIALALREALEVPGKTAALITPDRLLARRVAAALGAYGITADDSAGVPLARTPPAQLLLLVADVLAKDFAPLPLLALLKHPLCLLGVEPGRARQMARMLDRIVLRGPRPAPGLAGLKQAIKGLKVQSESLGELHKLLQKCFGAAEAEGISGVVAVAARLSTDEKDEVQLWHGDAGDALARFLQSLNEALPLYDVPLGPESLGSFLETLMAGEAVRPRRSAHPRLSILGPLEARMLSADLTILGGLNEGVWPRAAPTDPWLSRPMRAAIGLPEPERALGLSAHDFVQACSRGEVILSRAQKQDDAPAVPSRWLTRFETVLRTFTGDEDTQLTEGPWVGWVAALNEAGPGNPALPPRATPPVAARPTGLSVTEVQQLIRDPYAIYAKRVLGLKALDPLDEEPGAAERGQIIHGVLEEFIRQHPTKLPPDSADALAELLQIGEELFAARADRPSIRAFWWPRFEQIARWFIDYEYRRHGGIARSYVELEGTYKFETAQGLFALRGRADRIDQLADGTLAILDYKTGSVPSDKEIAVGFAPQLPLEAAMAAGGGFEGLPATPVSQLAHIQLTGREEGGKERPTKEPPEALGEAALEGLKALIDRYANAAQPYLSRPHVKYRKDYSDYDHLARLGEWQSGEGE